MASFNPTVITKAGQALSAKIDTGVTKMSFTRISLSSATYRTDQLENLTALTEVQQTTLVSSVSVINTASVRVRGAFNNASLRTGYYVQTIGLYAQDPDKGEILYSVTTAITADWMPPNDGVSTSSILIDLVTVISNATNVSLQIDPAATATMADITDLQNQIDDLKGIVGYTEADIIGVEVDLQNRTITRIGGAVGLNPGEDFDRFNMYGNRRRCILGDDGQVKAYYGEGGFVVDGSAGQVMVEQPKFYYKTVPLKLFKIDGRDGWSLSKFRLYLSDTPLSGFKLHPDFTRGVPATIKDVVYHSAFEGSIYDTSARAYLLNDEQVADFTRTTGDKLCSISGAKPCSGLTQNLTRANTRLLANNRGEGWQQADILSNSANQMLFLVEFASFDSQGLVGPGVTRIHDDDTSNMSVVTGACNGFGNGTGRANGVTDQVSIIYRGEENPWGNIWIWEDGLNVDNNGKGDPYFALGGFEDAKGSAPYVYCGFQIANTHGYVDAIGYSEICDFAFIATRTTGASNRPLNDFFYQNVAYSDWTISRRGGGWGDGAGAGAWCRDVSIAVAGRGRFVGGRLLFVPKGGYPVAG